MLGTKEVRTTNIKMNIFTLVIGCLIVGLSVTAVVADISLALRNKPYLPPPIQEVPLRDNYYNTQENTQQHTNDQDHNHQQQQHSFKKTNYANSGYQIPEIHYRYKPLSGNDENVRKSPTSDTNYLTAPVRGLSSDTEKLHRGHTNPPADFNLIDPNLDISYLGLTNQLKTTLQQTSTNSISIPLPTNYLQTVPEKSNLNEIQQKKEYHSQQHQVLNNFKGPDYLPPQEYAQEPAQNSLSNQHQVHTSTQQLELNSVSKTNKEYLPPVPKKPTFASITAQVRNNQDVENLKEPDKKDPIQTRQNHEKNTAFKSQNYLPPPQQENTKSRQNFAQNTPFKGPGYLAPDPPQHQQQQDDLQSQQNSPQNAPFKGPDYLPPHQQQVSEQPQQNLTPNTPLLQQENTNSHQNLVQNTLSNGLAYLTPHSPQHQQQEVTLQYQQNFGQNNAFKGPDYLPPHQQQVSEQPQQNLTPNTPLLQQENTNSHQNLVQNTLSNGHSPQHQEQEVTLQYQQNFAKNNLFKGPNYLPPHQQQVSEQPQQNLTPNTPLLQQENTNSHQNLVQYSLSNGHSPQHQEQEVTLQYQQNFGQNNPFKGPDYLPPHQQQISEQPQQNHTPNTPLLQQENTNSHQNLVQNTLSNGLAYLTPHAPQHQQQEVTLQYQQNFAQNNPFKGPDYLPPHQQQVSEQLQQNHTPNTPLLQQETINSHQNLVQNTPFKGPGYLAPDPPQHQQQQDDSQSQQNSPQNAPFKGPDYLPPHQQQVSEQPQQNHTPNTPLLQQENTNSYQNLVQNTLSNGPAYLTPHPPQHQQQEVTLQYQQNFAQNNPFKGPENLSNNQNKFRGVDHLSPHQEQIQQQEDQSFRPNQQFKETDYLSPQEDISLKHQIEQGQTLPFGYDFQKPANAEQAIALLHTLPDQTSQYLEANVQTQIQDAARKQSIDNNFKNSGIYQPAYDLLEPINSEQVLNQVHSQESVTSKQPLKSLEYLPPVVEKINRSVTNDVLNKGYSVPANAQHTINQLHGPHNLYQPTHFTNQVPLTQDSQSYSDQNSDVGPRKTHQAQTSLQEITPPPQQQFKSNSYLPPNSIPQTFKGSEYLPPSTVSQISKSPNYLPPVINGQNTDSNYKGLDYLPPVANGQTVALHTNQPHSQVFKNSGYLPSVNVQLSHQPQQQNEFKRPNYLSPALSITIHDFKSPIMYPLSSYMNNVKPNDRYAYQKSPLSKYSMPLTQPAIKDISPMYREPTSRPQYYAPTMSYINNAFSGQTYTTQNQFQGLTTSNQHLSKILQTFMPKDIQQISTVNQAPNGQTTTSANKPNIAKIRTVQIVNPNNVKTLKVLESLDNAGVKTIKILGVSLEDPMGDHRVVNVVNGNNEQNVQTIKIFNDHQDVTPNTNIPSAILQNQNNAYLPPRKM